MLSTSLPPSTAPASAPSTSIRPARTPPALRATASLFRAYAAWLDIDLSFQSFEAELADLPGKYARAAGGEILLAYANVGATGADGAEAEAEAEGEGEDEPVGCVALRDVTAAVSAFWGVPVRRRIAEVKRLYVRPTARGLGAGRALVAAVVDVARIEGYDELLLDTLPHMQGAKKLYRSFGFTEAEKYYENTLEGVIFMRCALGPANGQRDEGNAG